MRERLVVGNWKMHTNLSDAALLATRIRNGMQDVPSDVTVVVCPPTVWLYPIAEILEHSVDNLFLGAQNLWPGKDGRYTGEVSAWMLSQMCQFSIVGHSERRVHHMEDRTLINRKVSSALRYNIRPVLCVGEFRRLVPDRSGKLATRRGDTASDIFAQLRDGLEGLTPEEVKKVVIAYEPVWAIGSGYAAELPYVESVIHQLREAVDDYVGHGVGEEMTMIYGGSITRENAERFAHSQEIDGALPGGASLNVNDFIKIASAFHGRSPRES